MTQPVSHNAFLNSLRKHTPTPPAQQKPKPITIAKTDAQKAKCEICSQELSINEYLAKKKCIKYCSKQCLEKHIEIRDKLLH